MGVDTIDGGILLRKESRYRWRADDIVVGVSAKRVFWYGLVPGAIVMGLAYIRGLWHGYESDIKDVDLRHIASTEMGVECDAPPKLGLGYI